MTVSSKESRECIIKLNRTGDSYVEIKVYSVTIDTSIKVIDCSAKKSKVIILSVSTCCLCKTTSPAYLSFLSLIDLFHLELGDVSFWVDFQDPSRQTNHVICGRSMPHHCLPCADSIEKHMAQYAGLNPEYFLYIAVYSAEHSTLRAVSLHFMRVPALSGSCTSISAMKSEPNHQQTL